MIRSSAPLGPPINHEVNTTFQSVFTVALFVCAALVVWLALRRRMQMNYRAEVRFRSLVFVGAGLGAVIFEPVGDRLVQCWYYDKGGQWALVQLHGVSVPIWALPVYVVFVGASMLWIIDRVRCGSSSSELLRVFIGITAANVLIEAPILTFGGLYQYWGQYQPLWDERWFPIPAWVLILNWLLILTPTISVLGLMSLGKQYFELLIPIIVPCSLFVGYGLAGWPVMVALHGGGNRAVTTLAALLTVALSLGASLICLRLLPRTWSLIVAPSSYAGDARQ